MILGERCKLSTGFWAEPQTLTILVMMKLGPYKDMVLQTCLDDFGKLLMKLGPYKDIVLQTCLDDA